MIAAYLARIPTGIKMLLILSAALFPLGMIALFASIETARNNLLAREAETQLMASDAARLLSLEIERASGDLGRLFATGADRQECLSRLRELSRRNGGRYALFDITGRPICGARGIFTQAVPPPSAGIGTEVRLIDGPEILRLSVAVNGNAETAVGEFDRALLQRLVRPRGSDNYILSLRQGDARLELRDTIHAAPPLGERMKVVAPVAGGQLLLELQVNSAPLSAIDALLMLLPLLMWLAAALIGWFVVDRLLVRPLKQIQRAIQAHGLERDAPLVMPTLTTPSQEIRDLARAFLDATQRLRAHEAELEQGLARQTKLTREVHHRVKNNLQVVSSLINLHARGAAGPEVGAAYAAIQRRVDALAVVHRNHYAELEENRGLSLRALIGELAANLRNTAADAAHISIDLDLMAAYATQDVAVPVAFLITELVEMAMDCDPGGRITILLEPGPAPDRARLTVMAHALAQEGCRTHPGFARFRRVIEGLARQLRSDLRIDEIRGTYAMEIAVLP